MDVASFDLPNVLSFRSLEKQLLQFAIVSLYLYRVYSPRSRPCIRSLNLFLPLLLCVSDFIVAGLGRVRCVWLSGNFSS